MKYILMFLRMLRIDENILLRLLPPALITSLEHPFFGRQATTKDAITTFNVCIGVRDASTIVIGPGTGFTQVDRDEGPCTITSLKLKKKHFLLTLLIPKLLM
jgi:hypothetical protein